MFASLLRGAGLNAADAPLFEADIRNKLVQYPRVRLLLLDIPSGSAPNPNLVRSLRRLFPALHVVCLVPGPVSLYAELGRSGAALLVSKPVSARGLERVARGFLALGTEEAEPPVAYPRGRKE